MSGQGRLAGTNGVRVVNEGRGGRHRAKLDQLATYLRRSRQVRAGEDPFLEALVVLGRALADSLDRQEHDGDASEHVIATTASRYREVLRDLVPVEEGTDPATAVAEAMAAAMAQAGGDDPPAVRDPASS